MITLYIIRDDNPEGGYFSFAPEKPDMTGESKTCTEVRVVKHDEDLWELWSHGNLPPGEDGTYDILLAPLWKTGKTVWRRDD